MKFVNQKTGEFAEVSPLELRLGRLKKRLGYYADWTLAVKEMYSEVDNILITLTYRGVDDWQANHITEFIRKIKRLLGKSMFGYFWVAEMQKRGAVHYHVIVSVEKGKRLPKLDDAGLWTFGMTKIELVKKSVYGYLGKYLSKGSGEKYPNGIRIFACSIYILKKEVAENKLPMWLREDIKKRFLEVVEEGKKEKAFSLIDYPRYKKVKGGWKNDEYFFDSPYVIKEKFKKSMLVSA